jgi:hypothetical protein
MSQVSKTLWKMTDPVKDNNQVKDAGIEETGTGYGPSPELKPVGPGENANIVYNQEEAKLKSSADAEHSEDHATAYPDYATPEEIEAGAYEGSISDTANDTYLSNIEDIEDAQQQNSGGHAPIPPITTINVTQDFPWTYSPSSSRGDVPTMILREERILQNPVFNALSYNIFTATDHIPGDIAKKVNDAAGKGMKFLTEKAQKGLGQINTSQETKDNIDRAIKSAGALVSSLITQDELPSMYKDYEHGIGYRQHLEPYQRLYSTFPTGFKYKIPYFDDSYKSATASFGSESTNSQLPFQASLELIGGGIGSIMESLNAITPGTYIEQPKYPQFPASEKSYTLNFCLHNTVSWEDTVRNWQLVFMLIYQNLPNRVNRTVILPPKIYEARLPGVWYSRYSYMQNVSVQMLGARREMDLPAKELGLPNTKDKIKTTVPDAYQISITLQELIPESQNYMFESILRDSLVTIDRRDSQSSIKPFNETTSAISDSVVSSMKSTDQELDYDVNKFVNNLHD